MAVRTRQEARGRRAVYERWAAVFAYPGDAGTAGRVAALSASLRKQYPEAARALAPFARFVERVSPEALEEVYLRTFEVQALTTLELGYHLFGDDYRRGALLANLAAECDALGIDRGLDLPDHIRVLLRLVARHPDEESVAALVTHIVGPALRLCLQEFDRTADKAALYRRAHSVFLDLPEGSWTIYRHAIEALVLCLEEDFGHIPCPEPSRRSSCFLPALAREMSTEGACHECK